MSLSSGPIYSWEPIVFARTLSVDFRFLAMPQDVTPPERKTIEQYVLGALGIPESLEQGPRWLALQLERYSIAGVVCLLRDLIDPADPDQRKLLADRKGRQLYMFAGFASRRDLGAISPIVHLHPNSLRPFRLLLSYVGQHWEVTGSDDDVAALEPEGHIELEPPPPITRPLHAPINSDPEYVAIWEEIDRMALWEAVAVVGPPTALCLGIHNVREALNGPFLNVSGAFAHQRKVLLRERPSQAGPPPAPDEPPRTPTLSARTPTSPPGEVTGATAGAMSRDTRVMKITLGVAGVVIGLVIVRNIKRT